MVKLFREERDFGIFNFNNQYFLNELNEREYLSELLEYIAGERELDKLLIRAMAKYNLIDYEQDFKKLCTDSGLKFIIVNEPHERKDLFTKKEYIDLSKLDVSNITNLSGTFRYMKYFNQPLNSWDVSNVTNMSNLFAWAEFFNQPLDKWDTSNVNDMSFMFKGALKFNQDINTKIIHAISPVANKGSEQTSFTRSEIAMSTPPKMVTVWDVSNVTKMYGLFNDIDSFKQYLGDWKFHPDCVKPDINSLTFTEHNINFKFTEIRFKKHIEIFRENPTEQNKYNLIVFLKQFKEFDSDMLNKYLSRNIPGRDLIDSNMF
jgi:surface protein